MTVLRWYRGPERFLWSWMPYDDRAPLKKGYLRVRVFGFGFNFYWGEPEPRVLHCWEDRAEWIRQTFGEHSNEYAAIYDGDFVECTCMLPDGHEGPHVWTPDDRIGVTFADKDRPDAD